MSTKSFFTLSPDEVYPLALLCVTMTDGMMQDPETKKSAQLEDEFLTAFYRLRDTLLNMKDKNDTVAPRALDLDIHMAFAMIHSIVQPFYRIKGHLMLSKDKRKPISEEEEDEIEAIYYQLKDQAADLLSRLTVAWGYLDYGLQTLEEMFDLKIAVRQLKVDNTEVISDLTINKDNLHLFRWLYVFLDSMEPFQEEYEFAANFYQCRFFHIKDYEALRAKLKTCVEGESIELTLLDCIVLYYSLSLTGKFFISDAAAFYDEISEHIDAEITDTVDSRKTRDFFLKFGDDFMGLMRKQLRHNKTFMLEISRVVNW